MFTSLPLLLFTLGTFVVADLLGATYPAPRDLTSNSSLIASAWTNLSSTLDSFMTGQTKLNTLTGLENITFSLGTFSAHDPTAATTLQYHYTSPEIANSINGTKKVNGDSIYRAASITKLLTVYTALLELKPEDWERSLGEIFPGLAQVSAQDSVDATNWNDVTLSALAAQLGGVSHDGSIYSGGDTLWAWITAQLTGTEADAIDPASLGLPPLDPTSPNLVAPCLANANANCSLADSYLESVRTQPPAFQPWYSPGYSNNGFILLGIAISNITGRPIDVSYLETVFRPLGMDNSSGLTPNSTDYDRYVIPDGLTEAGINITAGVTVASGGLFTTINDLAKFGTAILNSTQLSPDETRKWMKPVTHTADLNYAIGRPWEIYRYTSPSSGKVIDLYTKQGDSGLFVSWLILIPDFEMGFSILSGSTSTMRSELIPILTDLLIETLMPAIELQTAIEAGQNFEGTYTNTQGLNSSIIISMNQSTEYPGLTVTSWISNGTQLTSNQIAYLLGDADARLVQTISETNDQQIAFRASRQNGPPSERQSAGLFWGQYTRNVDWLVIDSLTYGGIGLSLMIFDVDGDGKATAVTTAAFRMTLQKET